MVELETLTFPTAADLRAWLAQNADAAPGIWLVIAKKGAPFSTVSYAEAVDAVLEYGWIDGQAKGVDEHSYVQRLTPRRAQSIWSLRNVKTVEAKIERGEMAPRGLAEVERARADGRWDRAYAGSKDAEPHPDFLAALHQNPEAAKVYETLTSQNRFIIYFGVQNSKRADTRARRIAQFVEKLAHGETAF